MWFSLRSVSLTCRVFVSKGSCRTVSRITQLTFRIVYSCLVHCFSLLRYTKHFGSYLYFFCQIMVEKFNAGPAVTDLGCAYEAHLLVCDAQD